MKKQSQEGLTVKKSENFSEWYSQIIQKAEIVDLRLGTKGFIIIRPFGALAMENMYGIYEKELQRNGHKPVIMPSVIPESNLKKESSHVKGFTPEVFWLETDKDDEKLALRPTSETVFTPMFSYWIRSHKDLPLKLYQKGSVFRYDTKSTRPLIRGREFNWIEAHNAFATKEEAEAQVIEDIKMTETVMHGKFGIPFLAMKRPQWDKFAGAEYTIGSDVVMPDGKLIQQPSTHYMGQIFSRAFEATFTDKNEKEEYLYTTAYGPAISRILASVISTHGDDKGLVFPYCIAPLNLVIVPIYNKKNKEKVLKYIDKIENKLKLMELKFEVDGRDDYSPGWKFNEWELKGVPFRLEIGEREVKNKKLTLFIRDSGEKINISVSELKNLNKLGKEFDDRLLKNSEKLMRGRIVNCKTKKELEKAMKDGKIARVDWCSINEEGFGCAEKIEKDVLAEVRGTLANKKEKSKGKCIVCGKPAKEIVYIAKSY
ncbi:proline--tRNA ligase [Candidatus Woesearchaeota archaeon]|jgi:prolyl-tRNA synthetase|nr:proline--tRNA ligase [Candidatus Woesearchaeota archaeon]MBT4322256.1 proline--tRNA ligase [Candidatus Woesearchaeota archaeon]MBT4631276.1 proline--tRNA ligase [Candidatus Woesearchaeota archaeon]